MVGSIYVHLCKRKLSAVVNVHFVHCGAQCLICSLYFAVFYAQYKVHTVHLCKKLCDMQCALCNVQVCLRKLGNQFVQVTQLQTRTGHHNYLLVSHNTNQIQTVRFV